MKWFNDLRIGSKLVASFLLLAAVTAFVGFYGIRSLSDLNDMADKMYLQEVVGLGKVSQSQSDLMALVRNEKNLLLAVDDAQAAEYRAGAQKAEAAFREHFSQAREAFFSEAGKAKLAEVETAFEELTKMHAEVLDLAGKGTDQDRRAAVELSMGAGRSAVQKADALMEELQGMKLANSKAASEETTRLYQHTRNLQVGLIAAAALVSVLMGWFLSRLIGVPLGRMTEVAGRLAEGDVNQEVKAESKDEVGQLASAFGAMIAAQKELADAAGRIGRGDMTGTVQVRGERDLLGRSLVQLQKAIQGMLDETQGLVDAARRGQLDQRGEASRYEGAFRNLVASINGMMDSVVAPVHEAGAVLKRVAERDLTSRVEGRYDGEFEALKESINTAVRNLDQALGQVQAGAEQVAAASDQISHGSQSLASSTSQQAASLEEVSASVQEMASMAHQNSTNAREARGMAENARTSADSGMESMRRLGEAVDKIRESSDSTARILKTIDEIAFQTNLLALNAAVEAARAGDAGKGFAVVAEEVRNLAMRSAEAARNTATLIEESVRNARSGVEISGEVSGKLTEIHQQNTRVSEVMAEIAAASEQQTQGIDQVTRAIDELNRTTQHAAANSEESASAAEELSGQAGEMRATVGRFRLSGSSGPAAPARAVPAPAPAKPREKVPAFAGAGNGNGNGHARLTEAMKERLLPLDDDPDLLGQF